jgi:hypothetical protein
MCTKAMVNHNNENNTITTNHKCGLHEWKEYHQLVTQEKNHENNSDDITNNCEQREENDHREKFWTSTFDNNLSLITPNPKLELKMDFFKKKKKGSSFNSLNHSRTKPNFNYL